VRRRRAGSDEEASARAARKAAPSPCGTDPAQTAGESPDRPAAYIGLLTEKAPAGSGFMASLMHSPRFQRLPQRQDDQIRRRIDAGAWRSGSETAGSKPSRQVGGGACRSLRDSRARAPTSTNHGAGVIEALKGFDQAIEAPLSWARKLGRQDRKHNRKRLGSMAELWRQAWCASRCQRQGQRALKKR